MESRTRGSPWVNSSPLADLDVNLTLVNAGPIVQVAHVFWRPFSPFRFCFLSVCFGQILLFFFSHFCSRLRSPPDPIHSLSVCLLLFLCTPLSVSLLPSLPLSFLPPSSLPFYYRFPSSGSLDDNSVTTMWKLRSDTQNRKYCCPPLPENVGTLCSTLSWDFGTKGSAFTLPLCDVMPGWLPVQKAWKQQILPNPQSSLQHPRSQHALPHTFPSIGILLPISVLKRDSVGNLVRGPGMWTCFCLLQKGSVMLGEQDSR